RAHQRVNQDERERAKQTRKNIRAIRERARRHEQRPQFRQNKVQRIPRVTDAEIVNVGLEFAAVAVHHARHRRPRVQRKRREKERERRDEIPIEAHGVERLVERFRDARRHGQPSAGALTCTAPNVTKSPCEFCKFTRSSGSPNLYTPTMTLYAPARAPSFSGT